GRSALVVQAGTATSTRERGEPNSFNVLSLEPSRITLERRIWQRGEGAFLPAAVEAFERTNEGWERASPRDTRVQKCPAMSEARGVPARSRFGATLRRDAWWVEILPVVALLGLFAIYATAR